MSENRNSRLFRNLTLSCILATFSVAAQVHADGYMAPDRAPAQWLERLTPEDRQPIEDWIGYLPPSIDPSLTWITRDDQKQPEFWNDFFGKIVVIQSWTSANDVAKSRLDAAVDVVGKFSPIDVQLISLHIPTGAEQAARNIKPGDLDVRHMAAIDAEGHFADLLGIYETPVNLVLGRNGAVRYAGLSAQGLYEAIDMLLDEDPYTAPCSGTRPIAVDSATEAPAAQLPPFPRRERVYLINL